MTYVVEREVGALGNSRDGVESNDRDDGCTTASQSLHHNLEDPAYQMLSAMIVTNPLF
jgi:fructose/tagatose bisphosphate aldolase